MLFPLLRDAYICLFTNIAVVSVIAPGFVATTSIFESTFDKGTATVHLIPAGLSLFCPSNTKRGKLPWLPFTLKDISGTVSNASLLDDGESEDVSVGLAGASAIYAVSSISVVWDPRMTA